MLLAEKRLSGDPFEVLPKVEERQLDGNPLDPVRVDSLKAGEGINAIKPGVQIDFASGVTVIFGENGSGKSGFVRLLKRAAGVRTAEDILHNVRRDTHPTPSAVFGVTVGAISKPIEWKNQFGITPLNRTSVFDSRGARLHVEEDLSYIYTPGELTLFPFVQNAIERIRTALEAAITSRVPGSNTFLGSFDRACSMYATIETLGAATDIEEIRKYACLPENADAAIESLKTEIAALKSTNIQNELKRIRDRAAVVQSLKTAILAATAIDIATYTALIGACRVATQRREDAGSKAFDALGIPGVLTGEWRAFIQAGEDYLNKHASAGYPHVTDSCAYCQQPLAPMAIELIKKYRDFANNSVKAALDKADRDLREHIASITSLKVDALRQEYARETGDAADVLAQLGPVVEQIIAFAISAASRSPITWSNKDTALAEAERIVADELTRLTGLASGIQNSIQKRQEALKKRESALTELQAKKVAQDLLPQMDKRVSDAKWVLKANIVKNGMSGVLRSLTDAAKEASEELLNKGFEKRFQDECQKLRAPSVTLNFPGRQGQVTRRKMVGAYKPNQILSEGEQKALALADFFAEVTSVPASSPVIFDDPITSMDYRRIHEVCNRIVTLAIDHQVIVFTHNIWFAAELLSKADKKRWKYYDIRSEGGESGVVSSANHPRVDTMAQVSSRVRKLIEGADKADGEVKAALVEKGYEELRGLCEIVVEHEMLKGVVQRYAPNVMMTKAEKINVGDFQESLAEIIPVFDKACRYIASHSQPMETQGIRPTLDELKVDYGKVLKAREPHKE
jgi:energy-coupling factor transporter ATP-binding protein EcfA2